MSKTKHQTSNTSLVPREVFAALTEMNPNLVI